MDQHWLSILSIVIVLMIVGIIVDGIRRMRKNHRDSIKLALKPVKRQQEEPVEEGNQFGSEFPNGGARVSQRKIDPARINQVRNKYDFGKDMSAWKTKVAETIAEHTGTQSKDSHAPRIEPSMADVDPLLDDMSVYRSNEQQLVKGHKNDAEPQEDTDIISSVEPAAQNLEEIEEVQPKPTDESLIQAPAELTSQTVAGDASKEKAEKSLSDTKKAISNDPPVEPVQTSLNLEDAVPMLMDSVEEASSRSGDTLIEDKPESIVAVATHIEAVDDEQERTLVDHSANKPRYESKYTDHRQHHLHDPQEVLVIHARAAENEYFYGSDLLELILDNGLRFGAMDIFHRHAGDDGEGPILFSMANMVKPGVFDLHSFEEFSTIGLSFFLGLPSETGSEMAAFDTMLATAKDIAERLGGELKDENRSVLTKQTIEHYRERIRDFVRRKQLEKNKP